MKAITLLYPGMLGTPEEAILARVLRRPEKEQRAEVAGTLSYRHVAQTGDDGLIRWFHERGVPQVVSPDREVFRFA